MRRLSKIEHEEIIRLRTSGMSIPEITRATRVPKTTVQRHVKGTKVPEEFLHQLKTKQGGAKDRAKGLREHCSLAAENYLGTLTKRDYTLLLIALYWGEGTKRDFSIINSDPYLLMTVLHSLKLNGIAQERIFLSLRIHRGISISLAKQHWSRTLGMVEDRITRIEIIEGKKKGKLPYGMCRIRVSRGIQDRLLMQSAMALIGKEVAERVLSP